MPIPRAWRSRRARRREHGFTMVELHDGRVDHRILVAIGLPTFLGTRTRAQDRAGPGQRTDRVHRREGLLRGHPDLHRPSRCSDVDRGGARVPRRRHTIAEGVVYLHVHPGPTRCFVSTMSESGTCSTYGRSTAPARGSPRRQVRGTDAQPRLDLVGRRSTSPSYCGSTDGPPARRSSSPVGGLAERSLTRHAVSAGVPSSVRQAWEQMAGSAGVLPAAFMSPPASAAGTSSPRTLTYISSAARPTGRRPTPCDRSSGWVRPDGSRSGSTPRRS